MASVPHGSITRDHARLQALATRNQRDLQTRRASIPGAGGHIPEAHAPVPSTHRAGERDLRARETLGRLERQYSACTAIEAAGDADVVIADPPQPYSPPPDLLNSPAKPWAVYQSQLKRNA